MNGLVTRDLEILRTLTRLHFVPSAQLNATFFPTEKIGYRRLKSLADRDLIRRHTKGAPPRTPYCAWRITARGAGAVRDEFSEYVPEGIEERLAEQSLGDFEHREAISHVYLELIGGGVAQEANTSWNDLQLRMAAIRDRADQLRWHADGAVVLQFRNLGQECRLVPDATIEPLSKQMRLFLELDRSNKSIPRIEENLRRYEAFLRSPYRSQFPDGRSPCVVYIVRSTPRRDNVARVCRDVFGSTDAWNVLTHREAATHLAELLLDEARSTAFGMERSAPSLEHASEPEGHGHLRTAAHELIRSTTDLLKHNAHAFGAVGREQPDRLARWKQDLRALYDLVREDTNGK